MRITGKYSIAAIIAAITSTTAISARTVDTSMATMTPEEINVEKMKDGHKVVMVGDGETANADSIRRMIDMFYVDQFHHFKDPLAPYFLLMSRDASLAMGVGGAVRMRGWADFDGSIDANGFAPYMISVPSSPDQRRRIGGTPGGTSLFFRVIGFNPIFKNFNAYIQCDFSGADNVGFKLKKAYVTVRDWTIGYATTTFADPAAETPTIDGAGPNGKASRTAMLVRWMHSFTPHWSMAASIEMPSSHIDADGTNTKRLHDWMPDVVTFGQYTWAHEQHIRLGGILRTLPYRDLVNGTNHSMIGWGAQLSGIIKPINQAAIFAAVNGGRGYSSYLGDLSIGNYDLVSKAGHPGKMYAPWSMGLSVGAKYNFRYNVYACAVFGHARYFSDHAQLLPDDYHIGNYYAANIFWDITPRLQVGAEYLHGQRRNFDGEHASANRVDVLFQFAF